MCVLTRMYDEVALPTSTAFGKRPRHCRSQENYRTYDVRSKRQQTNPRTPDSVAGVTEEGLLFPENFRWPLAWWGRSVSTMMEAILRSASSDEVAILVILRLRTQALAKRCQQGVLCIWAPAFWREQGRSSES